MKRKITISQAAAEMGRIGGKKTGQSKARQGTSQHVKAWWNSPAGKAHRNKNKTSINCKLPIYL